MTKSTSFGWMVLPISLVLLWSFGCGQNGNGDDPPPDQNGNGEENGNGNGNGEDPIGPFETCDEIPSDDCFSHYDCEENNRCQDVGPDDYEVPCCVTGSRGTLPAGSSCDAPDGQLQCASGVCVSKNDGSFYCSDTCDTEADCPIGMKNCVFIAFSGSDDKWCLPD